MAIDIPPEQHAALLSVTMFPCEYYDMGLFWRAGETHDPVWLSMTMPFPFPAKASLGNLSALPTEIVGMICCTMDVHSLFRFRQVNRRARAIVSEIPQYRKITTCAIETFHALLFTRIAAHFDLSQFYDTFRARDCHVCGYFGNLLFLPNLRRCCYTCLMTSKQLHAASLYELSNLYPLSEEELGRILPVVHSAPGRYFEDDGVMRTRRKVVSVVDSMRTLHKLGIKQRAEPRRRSFRDVINFPDLTALMTTVHFPYLDRATDTLEFGMLCIGCGNALKYCKVGDRLWAERHHTYTTQQFLEHFQSCREAQELWRTRRGRTDCSSG
ncbi:uncharacterized protein B0T15DRAFT_506232 [Chaetomium strumarium]|uniref:F-box domain-containing protein n=1 Tax=Chaetomium strumarium TaxID=1170767 RepID=A0AAJ0M554_9PEZI|nr:hypothetical protein B0T15DRAFT_506232 [Chaetomium strumarium]